MNLWDSAYRVLSLLALGGFIVGISYGMLVLVQPFVVSVVQFMRWFYPILQMIFVLFTLSLGLGVAVGVIKAITSLAFLPFNLLGYVKRIVRRIL
jgi:hypothetical protein